MPMVNKNPAPKPKAMPMAIARHPVGSWRYGGGCGERHPGGLRGVMAYRTSVESLGKPCPIGQGVGDGTGVGVGGGG
jgi:hypothetical protein